MIARQRKRPRKDTNSTWPPLTTAEHAAIVQHLETVLEWALNRQSASALAHAKLKMAQTKKSMEYDTAVVRGLRWALDAAQKRPVTN